MCHHGNMSEWCIICSNSHCQHSPRVVGRTPMVATMYAKLLLLNVVYMWCVKNLAKETTSTPTLF